MLCYPNHCNYIFIGRPGFIKTFQKLTVRIIIRPNLLSINSNWSPSESFWKKESKAEKTKKANTLSSWEITESVGKILSTDYSKSSLWVVGPLKCFCLASTINSHTNILRVACWNINLLVRNTQSDLCNASAVLTDTNTVKRNFIALEGRKSFWYQSKY